MSAALMSVAAIAVWACALMEDATNATANTKLPQIILRMGWFLSLEAVKSKGSALREDSTNLPCGRVAGFRSIEGWPGCIRMPVRLRQVRLGRYHRDRFQGSEEKPWGDASAF